MLDFIAKGFRYLSKRSRAYLYKIKYILLGKRIIWGKNVKITGKLIIDGDGLVVIGDDVFIDGTARPVTPFTHTSKAIIKIGNKTFLNGTRLSSAKSITIGDNCLIAECSILDTDFHPVNPEDRLNDLPGRTGEIIIGDNVWVGGASMILRNTTIGKDSTVGAMSLVKGQFSDRSLIVGNPAKVIKTL